MKVTKQMADEAEAAGGKVEQIRKPKPVPVAEKPKPVESPVNAVELQRLRGEISELRGLLDQSEKSATQRVQELSAIISALSQEKPVRVKPVRDMDPASKTYLLVDHYDFTPVSYRKLDS